MVYHGVSEQDFVLMSVYSLLVKKSLRVDNTHLQKMQILKKKRAL